MNRGAPETGTAAFGEPEESLRIGQLSSDFRRAPKSPWSFPGYSGATTSPVPWPSLCVL